MRPTFLSALVLTFFSSSLLAQTPLQNEIRKIAADAHGTVSVSCSLPGSCLNCDLEPQSHPPMQSVFKLPLALCALHQIEQGKFSLDQPIRFLPSDLFPQGTFSPLQDKYPSANVDVPLREILRLAASLSDNTAADIVLRLVGGPTVVDAYIKSLGVARFHLEDGEHGLHRDPTAQYRNWFEPAGAVQFLRKLSDNSPLSPEHTELLLTWMKDSPTGPNRLKGALFAGFAGASGYYAGSVFFGQRPTRLLMLNIVIGSVLTFFFIHYLAYITLDIAGKTSAITFRSQNIWTLQSGPRRWSFASTAQTRVALSGTSLRCCRSLVSSWEDSAFTPTWPRNPIAPDARAIFQGRGSRFDTRRIPKDCKRLPRNWQSTWRTVMFV